MLPLSAVSLKHIKARDLSIVTSKKIKLNLVTLQIAGRGWAGVNRLKASLSQLRM